ncbi:MAG TPA: hypothetical protein VF456_25785 [Vicinamibacterales bacterium]
MPTATTPNVSVLDDTKSSTPSDIGAPVVLDFGKHRRKQIKSLRKGSGKLMDEVRAAVDELRLAGTIARGAQPVIVVVREKCRRSRGFIPSF